MDKKACTTASQPPACRRVVSVRKLTHKGQTYYEATWYVGGTRQRKWYKSRSAAVTKASKAGKAKRKSLSEFEALPDDTKIDLLTAHKRASRNGYTILAACAFFEEGGETKPAITFADAHAAFVKAKKAKNCRPRTLQTYKYIFEPFGRTFDAFDFHEIPKGDVLEWLTSLPVEPRTYNNYLNNLTTLRNWIDGEGYNVGRVDCFSMEQKLLDESEPCILEVDQVADYAVAACEIPQVGLVVVLVLFCGLRVEEACRTQAADIKLGRTTPIVTVKGQASKTRNKRNVELLPNAVAWVKYALAKGCAVPVSNDKFFLNRKRKLKRIGPNAMRHSFCSYHLAHFKNKNQTAYLAGNSPDIIDKAYKNLVEPEDAKRFWEVEPPMSHPAK